MVLEPNSNKTAQRNIISLKGREFQKYNLLKYRVICAIMDYMIIIDGVRTPNKQGGVEIFPECVITDLLEKNGLINLKSQIGRSEYNSILAEMKLMGLIEGNNEFFVITKYMKEAYQAQSFHQILASLLASEDSRTLSNRTLWISLIAVMVAIISIFFNLFYKI